MPTATKILFAVAMFVSMMCGNALAQNDAGGWASALPGWQYVFPADHAIHRKFKTEWWYFTGNLRNDQGHAYGYELTFFRQGVIPPERHGLEPVRDAGGVPSRFVQDDFKFAHFAISDLDDAKFVFTQKISRGAFGEAGFGAPPPASSEGMPAARPEPLARIENWSLQPETDGSWHITARAGETSTPIAIDLLVTPTKPPVIEGADGVSQKAAGLGNASHYYSFTRLKTTGTLSVGERSAAGRVHGESWFDHEWASNQLAADQVGWNWFCFQFDDQTELMLYAMRRRDGSVDPASSGTLIDPAGNTEYLQRDQFKLQPLRSWQSRKTGAAYPIEWQVSIPSRGLEFTVQARLDDQELVLPPISYWEGAIKAQGRRSGRKIEGAGYMELTGYAGALKGLQKPSGPEANLRDLAH